MHNLKQCNEVISKFESRIKKPSKTILSGDLSVGLDLGTAYIVLAVLNSSGEPLAGAYRAASVVRDGMVVDYLGAVDIVKELKAELELKLACELVDVAAAIPPGTESTDGGAVRNVAEAAGFRVLKVVDEPTAANELIQLQDGAVVDIGGGTTGVSIFKGGKVVHVVDEPSGGRHFSLVLAGAKKITEAEAEEYKLISSHHKEILPIVSPVIDKVSSIVVNAIRDFDISELVVVGGTACLTGIEQKMSEQIGLPVSKPINPMFVTPLGIALACLKAKQELVEDEGNGH